MSRTIKGHEVLSVLDNDSSNPLDLIGEDNGLVGLRCQLLKYNTSTLQWERWDGRIDTVVNGDLIVAVDGVEDKLDTLIAQGIIDVQAPLATDSDSLYAKDIWVEQSNIGNFSGSVTDLVDNLHSVISDSTANDPKQIIIHFNRTIVSNAIGLGSYSGNFSNVEIELLSSGNVYTTVVDESSSNIKYTSRTFQLPITVGFNGIRISFHTADTVTLSNLVVLKTIGTVARLQAVKPDNTIIDINATNGGNLKISVEELESGISVNSNSQLRTTLYDSDGIELSMDPNNGAIDIEPHEHFKIHQGDHFFICGYTTLGNAADIDFTVTTPNTTEWLHMTFDIEGTQAITLEIKEDAVIDAAGTSVIVRNNDRNSSHASAATIQTDPTYTDEGTTIYSAYAGANKRTGVIDRSKEIILKQNTTYIFRITNQETTNTIVSYCGEWYEHTNL